MEGQLSNGLIEGHAYSITAVQEVSVRSRCSVSYLRCVNPFGDQ